MDPRFLKEKYGEKFVFWGAGVNVQRTLPFGSPEEVRREVTHNLKVLSPGGGFVFNNVHNIQANIPLENVMALFEAVQSAS
jgi:uroporphyrinogen-III decarboxylase